MDGIRFESNQSGIETTYLSFERIHIALFESNQSGIETRTRDGFCTSVCRFESNQSGIETLGIIPNESLVHGGLNRTRVELKLVRPKTVLRTVSRFESNQSGIETMSSRASTATQRAV